MSKKTTVKAISLGYRNVGGDGEYTKLMGVLKGLSVGQDDPESTEIEAEFYDSPFDIFYDGNPVTMTFELANYDLAELPALFGGAIDANDDYEGAANAFTSEHEWKLEFARGHASLVIYRGLTIGTIKKDADGALNFSVTITSLVYTDGEDNDHLYKIVGSGSSAPTMQAVDLGLPSGTKWADCNLGAESPTDYGKYFSWGNVNGVSAGDTIDFSGGYENGEFTGTYGSTAGAALTTDITQGGANDAAAAALGTPWVMPTKTQFEELINDTYTTKTWTQQNGVNGYLITSKSNDNSIFLPAAGYGSGSALNDDGVDGNYWSSSVNSERPQRAFGLSFFSDNISTADYNRWEGCSVRPVQNGSQA